MNPSECSIFLHKYEPKHNDQVLKVDIENPIKQMRQKYFLCQLFIQKMIQFYVSVCSKSMWLSWISSSFKVHLCRGVFSPCNISNDSTWPVLFKEQGSLKVWSCLWKWIMSGTKEITEDLRKRVDVAHRARNVYKTISKEFDSTNPESDRFKTSVTFPRSARPTKITPEQNV